jgi:hypothetical protein
MTPKYWMRIVLGMLAIFAVGMVVTTGIRAARHQAEYVVEGSGPLSVPLFGMAFRLDDERLGGIERLRLLRSQPKRIDSAIVFVKLTDAAAASRFADCRLSVRDADNLSDKTTFFCADSVEAAALELVPFGHVEFQPSGEQVAIWIPASVAADMRESNVDGDAADSGDVEITGGERELSVKVNGKEVVSVNGTEGGGGLTVRDDKGREIVRIRGDAEGASVKVTESAPPAIPAAPKPAGSNIP